MNIIGYHIGQGIIANSDSEVATDRWLDFLFANKGDSIKVLYHLDYSVACLLKMLEVNEADCKVLLETTDLDFKDYHIQYIPNIWFSIKDKVDKSWCGFSDASQYAECLLDKKQNKDTCIEYANRAKVIGEKVYNALAYIGLHPKTLTSPISAYYKEVLSKVDLPTINDMPIEAAWYAYKSCKGSWTECFKRGYFPQTWDTDIRSAYASQLMMLLDIRQGTWRYSKEYLPNAVYGYCLGYPNITSEFSPIAYNNKENSYTPNGEWYKPDFYTKSAIEFTKKWKLGSFNFTDGWFWFPKNGFTYSVRKPLTDIVMELYLAKEEAPDNFTADIIKRILSGIWGRMLETKKEKHRFGDNFIPCWASEVQNNIRLANAEFALSNSLVNNVISIMVDGILFDKPVAIKTNGDIGNWKVSDAHAAIVVSSGVQCIESKPRNSHFAFDYTWLTEQVKDNPKATQYSIVGTTAISLQKAIAHNRFEDLANIETMRRDIVIDYEAKRYYKSSPIDGESLLKGRYDSEARDISTIHEIIK